MKPPFQFSPPTFDDLSNDKQFLLLYAWPSTGAPRNARAHGSKDVHEPFEFKEKRTSANQGEPLRMKRVWLELPDDMLSHDFKGFRLQDQGNPDLRKMHVEAYFGLGRDQSVPGIKPLGSLLSACVSMIRKLFSYLERKVKVARVA